VNDWAGTLPEFRAQLHRNVRSGSVDAALPTFSTSDSITAAAFTSTLMRALQNFFTCALPPSHCRCFSCNITICLESLPLTHVVPACVYMFACLNYTLAHSRVRYECCTRCGIPEVTLLGTIADWTDLHARFLVLADTWMQRTAESDDWVKAVDNFLKQFIAARSGETWKLFLSDDTSVFMQLHCLLPVYTSQLQQ
jgi:hypothetical protein